MSTLKAYLLGCITSLMFMCMVALIVLGYYKTAIGAFMVDVMILAFVISSMNGELEQWREKRANKRFWNGVLRSAGF